MNKRTSVFNLLQFVTIILLLSGCKKGTIENQTDSLLSSAKQRSTSARLNTTPDVYVAGSDNNKAVYWKNGVEVILPGGLQATGIAIVGTDVYVCGYGLHPTTQMLAAEYWKNGVLTILSNGTDYVQASGIAVAGVNNDVYVSGMVGLFMDQAIFWKNGVATSLGAGRANGIAISASGDVYMPNALAASYWLNGTLTPIPGGTSTMHAMGIALDGSNVHIVGTNLPATTQTPLYWKNGVAQSLVHPQNAYAYAVAVDASTGQAYISGNSGQTLDNMHIACWGEFGDLTIVGTGKFLATTTGIAVDGVNHEVYVCGTESVGSTTALAKYWKRSSTGSWTEVPLTTGATNATAFAITVQ